MAIKKACHCLSVPRSWYYRRQKEVTKAEQRVSSASQPETRVVKHQLSDAERKVVRETLNSDRFQDKSPRQVYATLLDEGQYYCHWRTMYRILAAYGEVKERRPQTKHGSRPKPELVARGVNEVWSWDITWLPSLVKGRFFYLYVIIDIYSRYVVGWLIAEAESGELAEKFIAQSCQRQKIEGDHLTLHADRGSPMRSKSVSILLQDLGIKQSHSRPRTSNDNPYSEAQFKTMKYRPDYPGKFETIENARKWAREFFHWYNQEHYHTGLSLLTPQMVYQERTTEICQQRQHVLSVAYALHPDRFKNGQPIAKPEPATVWINRPADVAANLH
jgi:putative transposase